MRRIVCAGLGAVALACGLSASAPARAAEVEKYLPNDPIFVVSMNVQQMLESSLMKKYALDQIKAAVKQNADVEKLLKSVGLDPLKDFSRVTIAAGNAEGAEKPTV